MSDSRRGKRPGRSLSSRLASLSKSMIDSSRDADKETPTHPRDAGSAAADQPESPASGSPGGFAKSERTETAGGEVGSVTPSRSPSKRRKPQPTQQESARAALLVLEGDAANERPVARVGGKGKSRKKATAKNTGEQDETERDDAVDGKAGPSEGHRGKGKGRNKGPALVGANDAGGVSVSGDNAHLEQWTKDEALDSLLYKGKPMVDMKVGDLRTALAALELSESGRKPELRMRLAQRLYSDIAGGVIGAGSMKGFSIGIPSDDMNESAPEAPTSRAARHLNRRRPVLSTTFLRKGPDTRDDPILISSSDDEAAAAAAAAEQTQTQTQIQQEAEEESEAAISEAQTAIVQDEYLAAGPQPGMTLADMRKAVKALGLKPAGTRKVHFEACWRDAVSGENKGGPDDTEEESEEETAGEEADTIDGVLVADMKVVTLKKYISEMDLTPDGKLKADLQKCLSEALRRRRPTRVERPGRSPSRQAAATETAKNAGPGAGGRERTSRREINPSPVSPAASRRGTKSRSKITDSSPAANQDDSREAKNTRSETHSPPVSPAAGRRVRKTRGELAAVSTRAELDGGRKGRKTRSKAHSPSVERKHTYSAVVQTPDRVRFYGKSVSDMGLEDMRLNLHVLEMRSHNLVDSEVRDRLVAALMQRQAEAAEKDENRQKWRGRQVTIMRKNELIDALEDLKVKIKRGRKNAEEEELRTRLRKELWTWAYSAIEVPDLVTGAGAGAAVGGSDAEAGGAKSVKDKSSTAGGPADPGSLASGRGGRRGRQTRAAHGRDSEQQEDAPIRPRRRGVQEEVVEQGQSASWKQVGGVTGGSSTSTKTQAAFGDAAIERTAVRKKALSAGGGSGGGGSDDDGDTDEDSDENVDADQSHGVDNEESSPAPTRRPERSPSWSPVTGTGQSNRKDGEPKSTSPPPAKRTPSRSPIKGKRRLHRREAAESPSSSPATKRRRGHVQPEATSPPRDVEMAEDSDVDLGGEVMEQEAGAVTGKTASPPRPSVMANVDTASEDDASVEPQEDGEAPAGHPQPEATSPPRDVEMAEDSDVDLGGEVMEQEAGAVTGKAARPPRPSVMANVDTASEDDVSVGPQEDGEAPAGGHHSGGMDGQSGQPSEDNSETTADGKGKGTGGGGGSGDEDREGQGADGPGSGDSGGNSGGADGGSDDGDDEPGEGSMEVVEEEEVDDEDEKDGQDEGVPENDQGSEIESAAADVADGEAWPAAGDKEAELVSADNEVEPAAADSEAESAAANNEAEPTAADSEAEPAAAVNEAEAAAADGGAKSVSAGNETVPAAAYSEAGPAAVRDEAAMSAGNEAVPAEAYSEAGPAAAGDESEPEEPVSADNEAEFAVAESEAEPMSAHNEEEPASADSEAAPSTVANEAEPMSVDNEAEPTAAGSEAGHAAASNEAGPATDSSEAGPAAADSEAEPMSADTEAEVAAADSEAEPITASNGAGPAAVAAAADVAPQPQIEDTGAPGAPALISQYSFPLDSDDAAMDMGMENVDGNTPPSPDLAPVDVAPPAEEGAGIASGVQGAQDVLMEEAEAGEGDGGDDNGGDPINNEEMDTGQGSAPASIVDSGDGDEPDTDVEEGQVVNEPDELANVSARSDDDVNEMEGAQLQDSQSAAIPHLQDDEHGASEEEQFQRREGHGVVDYEEGEDGRDQEDEEEVDREAQATSGGHHMVEGDEEFSQEDGSDEDNEAEIEEENEDEMLQDKQDEMEEGEEDVVDDDYNNHDDEEEEEEESEGHEVDGDDAAAGTGDYSGGEAVIDLIDSSEEEPVVPADAPSRDEDAEIDEEQYAEASGGESAPSFEMTSASVPAAVADAVASVAQPEKDSAESSDCPTAVVTTGSATGQNVGDNASRAFAGGEEDDVAMEEADPDGGASQGGTAPASAGRDACAGGGVVGVVGASTDDAVGTDVPARAPTPTDTPIPATVPAPTLGMIRPGVEEVDMKNVDPRAGMEEFGAILKEVGYDKKQDVMKFLANPESYPVNESLPILSTEQEARLLNTPSSASKWDVELILASNPFLQLAREHLTAHMAKPPQTTVGHGVNNGGRPSILDVVPSMRRGPRAMRPSLRPSQSPGMCGSAFGAVSRSVRSEEGSGQGEVTGAAQLHPTDLGPERGESPYEKRRADGSDWHDNDNPRRDRLSEHDEVGHASFAPSTPAPRRPPSARKSFAATSLVAGRTPSRNSRLGVGRRSLTSAEARRRSNSASVLRYRRRDLTPRPRARPLIVGEQNHQDAGTLGEWLGGNDPQDGGPKIPEATMQVAEEGGDARKNLSDAKVNGEEHPAGRGTSASTAGVAGGTRGVASSPVLNSVDTKLRRLPPQAAVAAAAGVANRAAARAKASAEVGSLLMDVVGKWPASSAKSQTSVSKPIPPRPQELAGDFVLRKPQFSSLRQELMDKGRSDSSGTLASRTADVSFNAKSMRPSTSRQHNTGMTEPRLAKRSLPMEEGEYDDDLEPSALFQFSRNALGSRRVRPRRERPLRLTAQSTAGAGGTNTNTSGPAPATTPSVNAPVVNGFDMSKFSKPGEWKCLACLVKNPREKTKCMSCETPKPGGGASTVGGTSNGFSTSSAPAQSDLLAGMSSSTAFIFGAPTTSSSEVTVAAATTDPAPSANPNAGFDMSKFSKPGEWKCLACFVKNPREKTKCMSCETPKPGGAASTVSGTNNGFSTSSAPAQSGLPAGMPSNTSFTFGAPKTSSGDVAVAPATMNPAPSANPNAGFDMSKFSKPGEWKCLACLVRNPREKTKCMSCETPKPGGAASTVGATNNGFSTSSAPAQSELLAGVSTSTKFTFGAPVVGGGTSNGGFQFGAVAPSSTSAAPAPSTFQLGAAPSNNPTGFAPPASAVISPSASSTAAPVAPVASSAPGGGFVFGSGGAPSTAPISLSFSSSTTIPNLPFSSATATAAPSFSLGASSAAPAPAPAPGVNRLGAAFTFGSSTGGGAS